MANQTGIDTRKKAGRNAPNGIQRASMKEVIASPSVLSGVPKAATTLVTAILFLPGQGWGHRAFAPRKVNRYAVLQISKQKIRIEYLVYLGAMPAMRVRSSWDKNQDGRLSAEEVHGGVLTLGRKLAAALSLRIDKKPVRTTSLTPSLAQLSDHRVRPSAILFRLEGSWRLSSGTRHGFSFQDKAATIPEMTPVGEIHIEIQSGREVRILESHTGTWSSGITERFRFSGPASAVEDRRIFVQWADPSVVSPGTQVGRTKHSSMQNLRNLAALLGMALLCLLGLVGTWYWLYRRKNRTISSDIES